MRGVRRFFSREKQVFLVGFSLTFSGFPRKSKIRLNTSLPQGKTRVQEYPPVKHLLNDNEGHLNLHESNHELCNEKERRSLNLKGSQWKLRQQHDQYFQPERAIAYKILGSEDRNIFKGAVL